MNASATIALLLISVAPGGTPDQNYLKTLSARLGRLAGPHAQDCGMVKPYHDPNKATECAKRAFHEQKPFYVVYQMRGWDSIVGRALVRNAEGKVYAVEFDSMNKIVIAQCSDSQLARNRTGRLACSSMKASPLFSDSRDQGICAAAPVETSLSSIGHDSGAAEVRMVIAQHGDIQSAEVVRSNLSDDTKKSITSQIRRWKFLPGIKDGQPVTTWRMVNLTLESGNARIDFPDKRTCNWEETP